MPFPSLFYRCMETIISLLSSLKKRVQQNDREITSTRFGFLLRVASGSLIRVF
jgi:hypothetical protein